MKSLCFSAIFTLGLAAAPLRAAETAAIPKDTLWVTRSVEYAALCRQVYRDAWDAVQKAAAGKEGPWAVVLDLDETVLDNSQYQVERAKQGLGYTPESWAEWVEREEAGLVPGAKRFLDRVRTLPGARIVYITNRKAVRDAHTLANLRKFHLYEEKTDLLLARRERADTKEIRRECVRTGTGRCAKLGPLEVLAFLGDNIKDFVEVSGPEEAAALRAVGVAGDPVWGTRYFVLPNPMYGSWERDYK